MFRNEATHNAGGTGHRRRQEGTLLGTYGRGGVSRKNARTPTGQKDNKNNTRTAAKIVNVKTKYCLTKRTK